MEITARNYEKQNESKIFVDSFTEKAPGCNLSKLHSSLMINHAARAGSRSPASSSGNFSPIYNEHILDLSKYEFESRLISKKVFLSPSLLYSIAVQIFSNVSLFVFRCPCDGYTSSDKR